MATIKGKLKTQSGDTMYPETSADKVIGLGAQVIVLEENGSTTAGTWLAKTDRISSLAEGQLFLYKVAVAGASTTTLNITASGTALGAKTIYRYGTTKLSTQYAVGSYILLYYNGSTFTAVNDYDANSYAYVRQYQASASTTGKHSILTRYNTTDKSGSYEAAYSRFRTDVTIDTSNGTVEAPKLVADDIAATDTMTLGGKGVATEEYVDSAIQSVGNPMVFKGSLGTGGTIASLPAAATGNKGYTYKVITAGTYQSLACKVGDVVVSDGTSWTLIPSGDEPSGTVTSVGLSVPTGFSVSGSPVTSSGTLSLTFASGYSLPTTAKQTAWDNKANSSDVKVTNATVSNTGSGNAVTSVSISSGQIVASKGTTFATSTQLAAKQDALTFNPTIPSGTTTTPLTAIKNGSNYYSLGGGDIPYSNTAPTGPNTSGGIKVVVLSSEPTTRYDGYLYIITGSN